MSEQYTYAVARIRALEVSLFSDSTIDQLIACQSYEQALQFLEEKGWGDTESSGNAEEIDRNGTFRCAFLSEAFS